MDALFMVCCALSVGLVGGFCGGGIKMAARSRNRCRRAYTSAQIERAIALRKRAAAVLKFVTFLFLALGLVWCVYYLVLGAYDPQQAEYATSMSQLIVSVLTIVSIGFAFFEFLRSSSQDEGEARLQEAAADEAVRPEAEGVDAADSAETVAAVGAREALDAVVAPEAPCAVCAVSVVGAPEATGTVDTLEAPEVPEALEPAAGLRTEGEARP